MAACTAGTWACPWSAPAGTRTETWALVCSAGMHSRHLDKAQHVPVLQEEACTAANLASGRSARLWEGMPDKDLGMPRCADCSKPGGHQHIAVQEHHHEVHTVVGDVQRRWAGSPTSRMRCRRCSMARQAMRNRLLLQPLTGRPPVSRA